MAILRKLIPFLSSLLAVSLAVIFLSFQKNLLTDLTKTLPSNFHASMISKNKKSISCLPISNNGMDSCITDLTHFGSVLVLSDVNQKYGNYSYQATTLGNSVGKWEVNLSKLSKWSGSGCKDFKLTNDDGNNNHCAGIWIDGPAKDFSKKLIEVSLALKDTDHSHNFDSFIGYSTATRAKLNRGAWAVFGHPLFITPQQGDLLFVNQNFEAIFGTNNIRIRNRRQSSKTGKAWPPLGTMLYLVTTKKQNEQLYQDSLSSPVALNYEKNNGEIKYFFLHPKISYANVFIGIKSSDMINDPVIKLRKSTYSTKSLTLGPAEFNIIKNNQSKIPCNKSDNNQETYQCLVEWLTMISKKIT